MYTLDIHLHTTCIKVILLLRCHQEQFERGQDEIRQQHERDLRDAEQAEAERRRQVVPSSE